VRSFPTNEVLREWSEMSTPWYGVSAACGTSARAPLPFVRMKSTQPSTTTGRTSEAADVVVLPRVDAVEVERAAGLPADGPHRGVGEHHEPLERDEVANPLAAPRGELEDERLAGDVIASRSSKL
jgi:hypothetical protein